MPMKPFVYILLQVIPFLLASCGADDSKDDGLPCRDCKEYAFRFEGDLFSVLYGIEEGESALYGIGILYPDGTPYAYGLFDSPTKAKALLPEGERFVYRAMIVPDGKTLCKSSSSGFEDIFVITSDGKNFRGCELKNEFVYSRSLYFYHFRIPQQSFYYKIYYGYCSEPDYLEYGVVNIDTRCMWTTVDLEVIPELTRGRFEFREMTDVGFPQRCSWDELSTPVFVSTPGNSNQSFHYSFRCWDDKLETIPEPGTRMVVGEIYRWYNERNELIAEIIMEDSMRPLAYSRGGYTNLVEILDHSKDEDNGK